MRSILPAEENPALREKSSAVPEREIGGAKLKALVAEMRALLAKEKYGVALAAVQVGEPIRLFIVSGAALSRGKRDAPDEPGERADDRPKGETPPPDLVFINPALTKVSRGKSLKHEGCLSIRGKWGEVRRAEKATLSYTDETGASRTRGASGFLAHIFQHEMDHLEGVLYTDKAEALYDEAPEQE